MATLPAVGSANYPTPAEIRDGFLRRLKAGALRRGLAINVLPGSDYYEFADAAAPLAAVAIANNKVARGEMSPLDADGDDLENIAGVYGVSRRPASSAAGFVILSTNGTVTIPKGFQATAPDGKKYKTDAVYTKSNGGLVGVVAVETGEATNQDAGTVLGWDSAAIGNLKKSATVDAGGIADGVNEDDDETLRTRLLSRISFPGQGGNWSQVKQWAEESTAAVGGAFVYAAARGPGSVDAAILAADGDRTIGAQVVQQVSAYVAGKLPGHVSLNLTSAAAEEVDIVLQATLPLAAAAGGAGGGWRDATPWPAETTKVTAYTAPTATVNSTATPTVGNNIGVWDPDSETMYEYVVASVGGGAGAWTITVQGGFSVSPLGAYVSAGAINLQGYAAAFLAAMQRLGPGQKSASTDILPRAARKPGPEVTAPTDLTSLQCSAVTTAYSEVLGLDYAVRYATGTTNPLTSPSLPATTADEPNVLVLAQFAIRK